MTEPQYVDMRVLDPLATAIGFVVTLAVFSYLFKDNILYRIVQKAAMGVAVGILVVMTWQSVLYPMWFVNIVNAFTRRTPWYHGLWLLMLIPGIMFYFQMSKKYFYLSRPVIALFVGVAAGLAFKNQVNQIIPQVASVLNPINPWAEGVEWHVAVNNIIMLLCFFSTLLYFSFTIKSEGPLFKVPMKFGRISIMVALGAMFGSTVMTRMAFLIERMQFLYDQVIVAFNWLIALIGQA